jgi:hypothetical protein
MATVTKNRNFFKWPKLFILSQNVPKFEMYKHNDEVFNIYTQGPSLPGLVSFGSAVSEEKI